MKITPRSYQSECVESFYDYFANNSGNPVAALPTGTGKSVVIALFLQSIFQQWPNQKVLVLTHVKELIAQNCAELIGMWPTAPAGIYSAGLRKRDTMHPIIFAGIASIARRAKEFGHVDLVVIDEAHLVSPTEETMYVGFLNALAKTNPDLKVIGLTATPWRAGQGHITTDGIFTDVCFDITTMEAFNRLLEEGYLAPLIPKHTRMELDVEDVHTRGGEFIASELQNAVDKHDVTYAALKECLEFGHDRKHWLIFASGVEHAMHICEMLNELGVSCGAVHSKMSDGERDQTLKDFKSGKLRAVVNNNVLTTGFNFPAIDLIVMLRPTKSTVLWVQMLGRGTRPCNGKENCLVLDFAGNTRRLGPINDPVLPRKRGEGGGEAPVKVCGACATYNHASARFCIHCGEEFVFETKLKQSASTMEIIRKDDPIVETFTVERVTFQRHEKAGSPPSMKVSYFCSYKMFNEFVCIEHEGWAQRKAREWWKQRKEPDMPFPKNVDELLEVAPRLKQVDKLIVWINKKYPEILSVEFKQEPSGRQDDSDDVMLDIPALSTPGGEIPF